MVDNRNSALTSYPLQSFAAGARLLRRNHRSGYATYLESGRVLLGVARSEAEDADDDELEDGEGASRSLAHQLGTVEGPGWLEVHAAVMAAPSAVDAVAETDVTLRRIPLETFEQQLAGSAPFTLSVLGDMARSWRRQTELAVSMFAKDAEARCAQWLLAHAQTSDNGATCVRLQQRKRLIAAELGIAPETLSRVLRHLRERCLISSAGRTVHLVDPNALRALAGT
jgi:CRP-like cAMP-binding protein